MDIVDAHTHVMLPPAVARRIRDLFDRFVPGQMAYPIEPAAVLERLAEEGVRTIWTLPYAHRAGAARRFNEHSAAAAAAELDGDIQIIAGATVHPDDPSPATVADEAIGQLGCGVLKLHCAVGGYRVDDPRLDEVFAVCAAREVPVVVHLGHAADGTTAAEESAPLGGVAARHRDVVFITAHAGHPAEAATLGLMEQHSNIWADLTPVVAAQVRLDDEVLDRYANRLLFGSDTPNTQRSAAGLLDSWRARGAMSATIRAVLGGNARRLVP